MHRPFTGKTVTQSTWDGADPAGEGSVYDQAHTMDTRPKDTRRELIEAALFCFSEHGFDGTSIRMIAHRAGRPLSLIGHHFGGKEGLYLEVFRFLTADSFASMGEGGPLGRAEAPRDRQEAIRVLSEQIHILYAEACSGNPVRDERKDMANRLLLSEMRNPRPEILELLKTRLRPWMDLVKASIQILRPDLSEPEIVFLGTTIMSQVAGQSLLEGLSSAIWGRHGLSFLKGAELLTAFSLQGLGIPLHR